MSGAIHGCIPEDDIAKKFSDVIGQKFKECDKAQTRTSINNFEYSEV